MFEFQSHLIFPTHAVPPAGPFPKSAEPLTVETPDGASLQGVHIPPDQPDSSRSLILGFGGNAWNGQDVAEYLHEVYPDHDIVAFHYRGYSPSTGTASARALIDDSQLVYDAAVERLKPARVIGVGFSIGTGVAAQLSAIREIAGLVLVTPFDSLKAVAQAMFPWLPIGAFFNQEIDCAGPLSRVQVPVALISAERDEIVPAERTDALRESVANLVFDRTIPRAGHNDIYARSDFHDAMHDAIERLKP